MGAVAWLVALAGALVAPDRLAARPFTLDDGLRLNQLDARQPIDLSPDGELLAFIVSSRAAARDAGAEKYLPTGVHRHVTGSEIRVARVDGGESRVLTPDWGTSWAPRWSPDGSRLAFYSDRTGRPLLWIWHRNEDRFEALDGAVIRTFFNFEVPEWSPDGRFVYSRALSEPVEERYAAEPAGWPWEIGLEEPREEGEAEAGDGDGPPWVEVFDSRGPGKTSKGRSAPSPGDGSGVIDLVRVEVATGAVERLVTGRAIRDFDLSPDGRRLAVMTQLGPERSSAQQPYFELSVVAAVGPGAGETLARHEHRQGYGISFSWGPGSERVAFVTVGPLAAGDLKLLDVASGRVDNLTEDVEQSLVPTSETYEPPLWSADGKTLLWAGAGDLWRVAADGSGAVNLTGDFAPEVRGLVHPSESPSVWRDVTGAVVAQTFDRGPLLHGFARIDPESGEVETLVREESSYHALTRFHVDVSPDGGVLVYRTESFAEPPDFRVGALEPGGLVRRRRLTRVNPHLRDVDLGEARLLTWEAPGEGEGSEEGRAILLLPDGAEEASEAGPDGRVPMIVWVYAGSKPSRSLRSFGLSQPPGVANPALLTGRGYAVLFPDVPLEGNDPLTEMVPPVEAAVDAALATGRIDPDRLGLFGHSYGGYSVNSLVTQTDRFAAAVSSTGSSNLASYFFQAQFENGVTGWFETGQGRMGGPPWEYPERYVANSPVFHLDRVTTPLLLLHSADDKAYWQSVEMYAGLDRLGKEAVLVRYEDAHHWFGAWGEDKLRDFWRRVLAWYDRHLGVESGPSPARR